MKDYSFLLDRPENSFPDDKIDEYFRGRSVLVTGAGGTIGSAICERLAGKCKFLVALGHSELPIFRLKSCLSTSVEVKVADVRLPMEGIFYSYKPDVVIHAAAHKHVGLLQSQPREAYDNNVAGTINVAQTAIRHHVEKFVFISTDKAAQPTSVMGKSKRLAELWLLAKYPSAGIVRFGNVLGSSGSLVEIIERRIAAGEPITITHPGMERFFITVREAAGLALTAAIAAPGIYTLAMGEQVNIVGIAEKLIKAAGDPRSEIVFSNPGSGEKLSENILNPGEAPYQLGGGIIKIGHPDVTERDFEDFRQENFS